MNLRSRRRRRPRSPLFPAAVCALIAASVAGCSASDSEAAPDPSALNGKTYLSHQVAGPQIPGGGPLVLGFADGRVSANAGCNGHGGTVSFTGDTMTTGELLGTLMACPPPRDGADRWVSDLLGAPLTWRLDGTTLTLTRGDLRVTLAQQQNRPVVGTRWQVTSLVGDQAVTTSAALQESKPFFRIDHAGGVTGNTGCNTMTGSAAVSGDTVDFSPLATTRMACGAEVTEVEQAVLAALQGKTTVEVDGDTMKLTNAADPTVGLRLTAIAD